ncbi:uncharacterized protein LAJ45_01908 [Morchella importuna]|uniref:uncharacterized protein n=1 Tax=Morchella importuna TaxID=1174673 RepID=UPI001E8DD6C5|nr:uncharacterized protein LAJ45_01908 [Morchella importuna]KAH8154140.1 hypothetical protein LAJ45_01908 [Morchella importuna]
MFVLPPPPPRYPGTAGAGPWGTGIPGSMPVIETNNTILYPKGPEHRFSVGEGTYVLKEDIFLATPPPHPSEAPVTNLNPLSTAPQPTVAGTKLSLVSLRYRSSPHPYRSQTFSTGKENQESDSRTSAETDDQSSLGKAASGSSVSKNGDTVIPMHPEKFGGGNSSLSAATGKDAAKRKKPKNNIAKNNSSFVSRIIPHENLAKRLAERNDEDLFVFANINRAFNWLDMDSTNKQEPLSKILFTKAHPICHDVNQLTRSSSHLDVIIGFSTGDIIWFDPMSNKYARLNKNGMINSHAVTDIKWLPGSENLFLAAHQDGSLIVYDKEKEDALFVPEDVPDTLGVAEDAAPASGTANLMKYFAVKKSVKSKNQRTNPVSYCGFRRSMFTSHQLRKRKVIGRVQQLLWWLDDDLVSIWSFNERRIVARCEGHHSWVSSVAFDPWRCDDRTYRFGSVGNDCRLLLWDFSVAMLHKPKAAAAQQHRGSMSSHNHQYPTGRMQAESLSGSRLRSDSNIAASVHVHDENGDGIAVHGVQERARTAVLPPIMSKVIDPEHLTQVIFREDSIITTCVDGHLKTWNRPHINQDSNGSEVTLSAAGS